MHSNILCLMCKLGKGMYLNKIWILSIKPQVRRGYKTEEDVKDNYVQSVEELKVYKQSFVNEFCCIIKTKVDPKPFYLRWELYFFLDFLMTRKMDCFSYVWL